VLAEHPDQRRQIASDYSLIPAAIEEVLRFEPPAVHMARYVDRDVTVHDRKIPKGSVMMFLTGAANRDDRRFPEGDRFDINREMKPNLSFGYGAHACLGRVLARLEGRIALQSLITRFPNWEIDTDKAVLSPTSTVRGWESLPMFSGPARRSAKVLAAVSQTSDVSAVTPVAQEEEWEITIKGPTGPMATTLKLKHEGGVVSGVQSGRGGASPIAQFESDGGNISWTGHVEKPMKMKLEYKGVVSGGKMSGMVKAGFMGTFSFTGKKSS
jgi:hypothetical protein